MINPRVLQSSKLQNFKCGKNSSVKANVIFKYFVLVSNGKKILQKYGYKGQSETLL